MDLVLVWPGFPESAREKCAERVDVGGGSDGWAVMVLVVLVCSALSCSSKMLGLNILQSFSCASWSTCAVPFKWKLITGPLSSPVVTSCMPSMLRNFCWILSRMLA